METLHACRTICFNGEITSAELRVKISNLLLLLSDSKETIKFTFQDVKGGDLVGFLELATLIKGCGTEVLGYAYDEVNSNALLPFTSCSTSYYERDCVSLIHQQSFPPLPISFFREGKLPELAWQGALHLQGQYINMLVSNCQGKLQPEMLIKMMDQDNHKGCVIDSNEALKYGIADRLFTRGEVKP